MVKEQRRSITCKICGKTWRPIVETPVTCPFCRRPDYDRVPRRRMIDTELYNKYLIWVNSESEKSSVREGDGQ